MNKQMVKEEGGQRCEKIHLLAGGSSEEVACLFLPIEVSLGSPLYPKERPFLLLSQRREQTQFLGFERVGPWYSESCQP